MKIPKNSNHTQYSSPFKKNHYFLSDSKCMCSVYEKHFLSSLLDVHGIPEICKNRHDV